MIVVSDTSCITALLNIDQAEILHRLYNTVVTPIAVERELLRHHSTLPELKEFVLSEAGET